MTSSRRYLGFGLLLLLAGPAAGSAAAQAPDRRAAEAEIVQLERDWDRAFLRNDTAFVERVLAPEFIAVYPDGTKGDRAKEIANAAAFNQKIESSTLEDFTVQFHGDTAVVWFRRTLVGPSKGQRLEVIYQYLDVFVRRDGRWLCVASQSLRVPPPSAAGAP